MKASRRQFDGVSVLANGVVTQRRRLSIDNIHIGKRHRPLNDAKVAELAKSIAEVGLMAPPAVCIRNDVLMDDGEVDYSAAVLIYGRHRLAALKLNGEESVDCVVFDVHDLRAELLEISENLHRSDLTALQRDEQVARWIELTATPPAVEPDEGEDGSVSRQVDAKLVGRPEGGTRAAARQLGISEPDARRALKVASLSPEAKVAAVAVGLDNNRTALLNAAKESDADHQATVIREWGALRELRPTAATVAYPNRDRPPLLKAESIRSEDIEVVDRLRPGLHEETATRLMDSIRRVGLLHPIAVRFVDGFIIDGDEVDNVPVLVAGRHRLEAMKRLGESRINCLIFKDQADAAFFAISENLHRSDLTAPQRTEHEAQLNI